MVIANLLQREGASLRRLDLNHNDICDEGAEYVVASLNHNNALDNLRLNDDRLTERGCLAFLKLLIDVSSIESTFNSNHTLRYLYLSETASTMNAIWHIDDALRINRSGQNSARLKVIDYQLDCQKRQRLCHIQGVTSPYSSIFSDIDALVLPEVLALVGRKHGRNEMYSMLIAVVPDLVSIVNKEAALKERIEENVAQLLSLETEYEAMSLL
jgi:hypothetical protein